jgi:CspA family cold shock protein
MSQTGMVKWFDPKKGYGFIVVEGVGDVFVHYSDIEQVKGFRSLREGQQVRFTLTSSDKGHKASNVVRTDSLVAARETVSAA